MMMMAITILIKVCIKEIKKSKILFNSMCGLSLLLFWFKLHFFVIDFTKSVGNTNKKKTKYYKKKKLDVPRHYTKFFKEK